MRRLHQFLALTLVLVGLSAAPLHAQSYPERIVRLTVAFAPGGPLDLTARPVAAGLEAKFGKPFVLDFKQGANGVIGSTAVANAEPDGYTLLVISSAFTVTPSTAKLPFDTAKTFQPVAMFAKGDIVLIANPALGVKTLPELIAKAKAAATPIKFGSSGFGGSLHLAGELLKLRSGTNMIHVPYNGANQVVIEVVAGNVDMAFVSLAPAVELIKAGKLVALGIAGSTRAPTLPDVPTLKEAGIDGIDIPSFFGLVAPAKVPPAIVAKLNAAINEILNEPGTKEKFATLNLDATPMSTDAFGKFLNDQIAAWGQAVKAAGIEPQ